VNPALIFQGIVLIFLGIAGFIVVFYNLKRYCDLSEKEDKLKKYALMAQLKNVQTIVTE
jgi:hypothetical protein